MILDAVRSIPGLMTSEELECLCRMARSAQTIVELGCYKGRSLAAMMLTNPRARAWAVDWFRDMSVRGYRGSTEAETRACLAGLGLEPAGILSADTTAAAKMFCESIDLLHVDAGHSYEECKGDLEDWVPKITDGGAVCIHDYGVAPDPMVWRPGVQQAVDEWRDPKRWTEVERSARMIAFRHIVADEGALYVAYGDKARAGAQESIASLKEVAPSLPVAVVSDTPFDAADYPIVHVEVDRGARAQKTRMYSLSPFQRTLYLDADTRVLSSPSAGFKMLDWGDVVLAQDRNPRFSMAHWRKLDPTERDTTSKEVGTEELMYWNSGAVFFRRHPRVQRMMQTWHREWLRWQQQDQMALLRAISQAPVRIVGMRSSWNTNRREDARFVLHMHHTVARDGAPG